MFLRPDWPICAKRLGAGEAVHRIRRAVRHRARRSNGLPADRRAARQREEPADLSPISKDRCSPSAPANRAMPKTAKVM